MSMLTMMRRLRFPSITKNMINMPISHRFSAVGMAEQNPTRCIDVLKQEHFVINKTLNAFNRCVSEGKPSDIEQDWKDFAIFLKVYSDEIHHYKEENILVEILRKYEADTDVNVINEETWRFLQKEHENIDSYMTIIGNNINLENRNSILNTLKDLGQSLQQHVYKEDKLLFPKIMHLAPPEIMETISQKCEQFMQENKQKEENCISISDSLCNKYLGE
eukprot:UN09844